MKRFTFSLGLTFISVMLALLALGGMGHDPIQAALPPEEAQAILTVNSSGDTDDGACNLIHCSFREALTYASSGDTIIFDPAVFPPISPVTIVPSNQLPDITQGNLTIDASNAGVILDGSGIGTTPDAVRLDDVSLTLDGGTNLIVNGDFSGGLGHWRPQDDSPGATRSLNSSDFTSSPYSYEWSSLAHTGDSHTVYDTADTSDPFDDWPYYDGSTVWISASGGSTAEVRFWYKYGGIDAELRALFPDDHHEWLDGWWFDWEANWTEAVVNQVLPGDAIGVALELRYSHRERWTTGLSIRSNGNTIRGLQIVNFPGNGIGLYSGAQNNTIGGTRGIGSGPMGQGNLLSGNGGNGVGMWDTGTSYNTIVDNRIGTDLSGTSARGNRYDGVHMNGASHNQVIDNLISGNAGHGVSFCCTNSTSDNTVSGNYIGTDASGTVGLGNGDGGVSINSGASSNLIGGDSSDDRNIISGNGGDGVGIWDSDTMSNTVSGNHIGTDVSGAVALSNDGYGIAISSGASYNLIGGSTDGERNIISANGGDCGWCDGIFIGDAHHNTVQGNYIGTDVTGTSDLGNRSQGIHLFELASDNTIQDNVIAASGHNGIAIWNNSTNNTVSGNYIGTNASGTLALPNGGDGVSIYGASYNLIGGDAPSGRNIISGNVGDGVGIWDSDTMSNTVSGNYIGTDVSGAVALSNDGYGIAISSGASYNLIGGSTDGERNIISANGGDCNWCDGVFIDDAHHNTVQGNYIGTDVTGTSDLGNHSQGIHLFELASDNTIQDNVIAASGHNGIAIWSGSSRNLVESNLISGNGGNGVHIFGDDTLSNTVTRNSIHDNSDAGIELSNGGNGELPPPVITNFDLGSGTAAGIACANCTVEIFSDSSDEGETYEGQTPADGTGTFTFNKGAPLAGPNLTATATDDDDNTSEFSAEVPPICPNFVEPWDIVDSGDIQFLAVRWRQLADLYDCDDDGRVTIVDLMCVVTWWGESCK